MPTSIGYLLFRQKGGQSALAIFAELEKSYKYQMLLTYKEYLRNLEKKHVKEQKVGKGYREIIKQPIANYAGSDKLIKRLLILLASVNAGNTNQDILNEYTTILDELMDRNKIDTFLYKVFLKKMKSKLGLYK